MIVRLAERLVTDSPFASIVPDEPVTKEETILVLLAWIALVAMLRSVVTAGQILLRRRWPVRA